MSLESNINILPIDILANIFTYLHGGMILRCSSVCKKWKIASEVDWLWVIKMGDELEDIKQYTKEINIFINKEIAKQWIHEYKKPLIRIYVKRRRIQGVSPNLKIFPIKK